MPSPSQHPKRRRFAFFRAEVTESFLMAMGALAAHKLRSLLTLLGVLVGVFSIIVVMTAMRVMQNDIEKELSRLGCMPTTDIYVTLILMRENKNAMNVLIQ